MPHHLMNLRHVPDDEADEIRELLSDHDVPYYETPPSFWGISMGGFWVHDDQEAARAKALLRTYQQERRQRQRQAWDEDVAAGRAPGLRASFGRRPLTFVAALAAIGIILALSLGPFINLS